MHDSNEQTAATGAWLPWCLLAIVAVFLWRANSQVAFDPTDVQPRIQTADFPRNARPRTGAPTQWESRPRDGDRFETLKPQLAQNGATRVPQFASSRPITPRRQLTLEESANIDSFRRNSASVVFIKTAGKEINPFSFNTQRVRTGSGSGFVWDRNGHIVTNYHVVLTSRARQQTADFVQVFLADQSSWRARVVGVAPDKDLAVLKIDAPAEDLTPLPLGTSSDLLVGQKVLAIGSPFGLDQTLTTGIISGLSREIQSVTKRTIDGVIQTDAAINPGNSGGPLLDSSGRLIGVNTAIYSPSGAYAGIGFAIPVDTVSRYVPELIENGQVVRPWLGVSVAPANVTRQHGIEGVLVINVSRGGTAADAGVRPTRYEDEEIVLGDIIIAMDDMPITSSDDLLDFLYKRNVGEQVTITVLRDIASENRKRVKLRGTLRSQLAVD